MTWWSPRQVWAMLIGRRGSMGRGHTGETSPATCLLRRPLVCKVETLESQKGPDTSSLFPRCGDVKISYIPAAWRLPSGPGHPAAYYQGTTILLLTCCLWRCGFSTITAELGGSIWPMKVKTLSDTAEKKPTSGLDEYLRTPSCISVVFIHSSLYIFFLVKTYMLSMCCVPAPGTERLASVPLK